MVPAPIVVWGGVMANGKLTVTPDELRAILAGEHGAGSPTSGEGMDPSPGPPPNAGRGRRRRGPDAGPRLTADRLHERAVAVLYTLRGLSRSEQRRVLERAMGLLER